MANEETTTVVPEREREQPAASRRRLIPRDPHAGVIWGIGVLVVVSLWVRPMFSSLWLDELGTWWVIKDGFSDAIDRAIEYQGQSPLFYVIAWGWRRIAGSSEFALRMPSLVAYALATFLLYRLARRLFDEEVARIAAVVFAASITAFSASDFRPYSLAILFIVAASLALISWFDRGGLWLGVLYAILAALVVWAHYFFALALLAHIPYAIQRTRSGTSDVRLLAVVGAWLGTLLLIAPLTGQILELAGRDELIIPGPAAPLDLLFILINPSVAVPIILGVILASLAVVPKIAPRGAKADAFALLVPWAILPSTILLGMTMLSSFDFPSNRYMFSAAPALAILTAWLIGSLSQPAVRRICVACMAIIGIATFSSPLKVGQDWRAAAAATAQLSDEETVILAHPKLIESDRLDWFADPEKRSYLLSVFSYYPVPGELVLLPFELDDAESFAYMDELVEARLLELDRFLLITKSPEVPYAEWLDGRLASDWGWREVGSFGNVTVFEFTRDSDERSAT